MTAIHEINGLSSNSVLTNEQFLALSSSLSLVESHSYLSLHNLDGQRLQVNSANDDLFMPLHNTSSELTGYKQLTGDDEGQVFSTGNECHGFFQITGDEGSHLILLVNDYVTAKRVYDATNYTTLVLGSIDSLENVIRQVAPMTREKVAVYCIAEHNPDGDLLLELAIESIECTEFENLKCRIDEVYKKASLRIPKGFVVNADGVHTYTVGKNRVKNLNWVCSPIWVTARTRDTENESWGRFVKLVDSDGKHHSFALPMEMITSDSYMPSLVNRGLIPDIDKKSALRSYLSRALPIQKMRCLSRTGWYEESFLFPNDIIGESDEQLVYQPNNPSSMTYKEKGTLQEWQDNVASFSVGNSRLLFSLSVAFSSMMLKLVNGKTTGFHFRSGSSKGKSTLLRAAQSVFNDPESIPLWHSTISGLESLAANHNHTLLCLDEFGQLVESDPKIAAKTIYTMGNGRGKQRIKSNGEARGGDFRDRHLIGLQGPRTSKGL